MENCLSLQAVVDEIGNVLDAPEQAPILSKNLESNARHPIVHTIRDTDARMLDAPLEKRTAPR
jgi:hypothetical protein